MTTRAAKTRFPVVPTEAEEATDDSPPRPCLVFALRNAFINLDDAEFEFEVAIERRRRCVPFIKALRNAFLHVQVEQFEAEIAIEKQRRRDSRKKSPAKEQIIINSSNNIKTSKVELLADIQAKLSITKSIMKLAPATIKNDGAARNSAISNNETTSIDNEGRLERVMMMATRDRLSHTERIPLGRWHKEDGSNNNIIATPTTNTNTNNNNSSETQSFPVAKAHMETIPTTFAPASAGGGETTTLINKKRPPSFDDDNDAETESEDEETETEKQDEGEVEIADDDDSSWNSADSIMTGLGSKKAAYTSKFFVGTPLPATTLGHNVNQPGNDNVSLWTEEEDICLKKIMKRDRHHKKISRNWDVIAKEMGRNRTAKECHERWILRHQFNKPSRITWRRAWTEEEDALVMQHIMGSGSEEQPYTKWSELASRLPGRNGKQIRERFKNCLNPSLRHYPFSRDEDLLLWAGHKAMGTRWVDVSVKFFKSTRSENQIKNRWNSAAFKRFVAEEFGPYAKAGSESSTRNKKMARPSSSTQLIDSTTTKGLIDLT